MFSNELVKERIWISDRLRSVGEQFDIASFLDEATTLLQRRRTIDFVISAGSIVGRIQDDRPVPYRARLGLKVIEEEVWDTLAAALARRAWYLGGLLSGYAPQEIRHAFIKEDAELLPDDAAAYEFTCECRASGGCVHRAALLLLTIDHFMNDPFSLFAFRGRQREMLLADIRRHRHELRKELTRGNQRGGQLATYERAPQLEETIPHFWDAGKQLEEISYSIKADELPASIIRRLDPMPLGDLQTEAEMLLEEIYAQVARRAQSLGLFRPRTA